MARYMFFAMGCLFFVQDLFLDSGYCAICGDPTFALGAKAVFRRSQHEPRQMKVLNQP